MSKAIPVVKIETIVIGKESDDGLELNDEQIDWLAQLFSKDMFQEKNKNAKIKINETA